MFELQHCPLFYITLNLGNFIAWHCGGNLESTDWTNNQHAKVNEDTLVTVDVAYAGVNYADVCIRWGLYSSAKKYNGYPITPGFEFSGTVQSVGSSVTQFKKGDNVFGVTMFGAYSTRVTVPECQLFKPTSASPFTQRKSIACCLNSG